MIMVRAWLIVDVIETVKSSKNVICMTEKWVFTNYGNSDDNDDTQW